MESRPKVWDVPPAQKVHLKAESTIQSGTGSTSLQQYVENHLTLLVIIGVAVLLIFVAGWGVWFYWHELLWRMQRLIRNIQQFSNNQTAMQGDRLADIEQETKRIQRELSKLFQQTYAQAFSDLQTINRLRQHASLTSEEKELLAKLEERYMQTVGEQLCASYEALLAQFQERLSEILSKERR